MIAQRKRDGVVFLIYKTVCILFISTIAWGALAESLEDQRAALELASNLADSICSALPEGSPDASLIASLTQAKIDELADKMDSGGLTGSDHIRSNEFRNALQGQLMATANAKGQCRVEVFRSLATAVMTRTAPSPHILEQTRESGWRGGGYNPNAWCTDYISMLRGQFPFNAQFEVMSMNERQESRCKPFKCPQYNYSCTVRITIP